MLFCRPMICVTMLFVEMGFIEKRANPTQFLKIFSVENMNLIEKGQNNCKSLKSYDYHRKEESQALVSKLYSNSETNQQIIYMQIMLMRLISGRGSWQNLNISSFRKERNSRARINQVNVLITFKKVAPHPGRYIFFRTCVAQVCLFFFLVLFRSLKRNKVIFEILPNSCAKKKMHPSPACANGLKPDVCRSCCPGVPDTGVRRSRLTHSRHCHWITENYRYPPK